ncbi:hypothetical protein B0H19DRAFT_1233263 [Mycena capillaripes]|nr:hypothetical protein B0H19DRAFT_1233263 [Mycena capillaripes]
MVRASISSTFGYSKWICTRPFWLPESQAYGTGTGRIVPSTAVDRPSRSTVRTVGSPSCRTELDHITSFSVSLSKDKTPRDTFCVLRRTNVQPEVSGKKSKDMAELARDDHNDLQYDESEENPERKTRDIDEVLQHVDYQENAPGMAELGEELTEEDVLKSLAGAAMGRAPGIRKTLPRNFLRKFLVATIFLIFLQFLTTFVNCQGVPVGQPQHVLKIVTLKSTAGGNSRKVGESLACGNLKTYKSVAEGVVRPSETDVRRQPISDTRMIFALVSHSEITCGTVDEQMMAPSLVMSMHALARCIFPRRGSPSFLNNLWRFRCLCPLGHRYDSDLSVYCLDWKPVLSLDHLVP